MTTQNLDYDAEIAEVVRLQLVKDLAAVADEAQPSAECPPADRIWEAVDGTLSQAEIREVLDHAALCQVCADAWCIAADLQEIPLRPAKVEPDPVPDRVIPPQPGGSQRPSRPQVPAWPAALAMPWFRWPHAAMATLAAMVLVVVLVQGQRYFSPLDRYRDGSTPIVAEIKNEVTLPRDSFLLRWSYPGGDEVRYDLIVRWRSGNELGQTPLIQVSNLQVQEYLIPESKLETVPSGAKIYWNVVAWRGDEQVASNTFLAVLQ